MQAKHRFCHPLMSPTHWTFLFLESGWISDGLSPLICHLKAFLRNTDHFQTNTPLPLNSSNFSHKLGHPVICVLYLGKKGIFFGVLVFSW